MRGRARLGVVASVVAALALVGCSSEEPSSEPSAGPTPLARLDASLRLAPVAFCDEVPEGEVRRALGAEPTGDEAWGNGDVAPTGADDVAHELGCAWTSAAGTSARAWVFARAVDTAFAATLVDRAGTKRCTAEASSTFGRPALLQTCSLKGGLERVRRAGLFGDTWVTCEIAGSTAPPRERLDRWCAATAAALDAGRG